MYDELAGGIAHAGSRVYHELASNPLLLDMAAVERHMPVDAKSRSLFDCQSDARLPRPDGSFEMLCAQTLKLTPIKMLALWQLPLDCSEVEASSM